MLEVKPHPASFHSAPLSIKDGEGNEFSEAAGEGEERGEEC